MELLYKSYLLDSWSVYMSNLDNLSSPKSKYFNYLLLVNNYWCYRNVLFKREREREREREKGQWAV